MDTQQLMQIALSKMDGGIWGKIKYKQFKEDKFAIEEMIESLSDEERAAAAAQIEAEKFHKTLLIDILNFFLNFVGFGWFMIGKKLYGVIAIVVYIALLIVYFGFITDDYGNVPRAHETYDKIWDAAFGLVFVLNLAYVNMTINRQHAEKIKRILENIKRSK